MGCAVSAQEKAGDQGEDGSTYCSEDQPVDAVRVVQQDQGQGYGGDEADVERQGVVIVIEVFHPGTGDHPSEAQIESGDNQEDPRAHHQVIKDWEQAREDLGERDPWGCLRVHGDSCLCCHGMSLTVASDRHLCGEPME